MKRIMLKVAYDGTNYCGWQVQPNGITIEGVLNRELSALLGATITVIGASRTDSGVHAMGNVCVFDTESRIPGEKFAYALNARLPQDIVVQESREVREEFHPRHCDCQKTYEYRIYQAAFPNPLLRRQTHFLYRELDTEAMREAAAHLVGEHDFKSFCSVNTQVKDTVRTIYSIVVMEELQGTGKLITIRIRGNGFLYNMVRIIAGTLIETGYHRHTPQELPMMLAAMNRSASGATAPACGLTLMEIKYAPSELSDC